MASKTRIEDTRGKIDFSQSAEPTLNSEQTQTGWFLINYLVKGINWVKVKLGDKADESREINYTSSSTQLTNNQTHLLSVVLNTYGGNIAKLFSDLDALGIKDKKEYPITGSSGTILVSTHNISNPSVVAFYKNGTPIELDYIIASNGNISWASSVSFLSNSGVKVVIIG